MEKLKFDSKKVNYIVTGIILACAILSLVFCFLPFTKTLVGTSVTGLDLLKYKNATLVGSMITLVVCLVLDMAFMLFYLSLKIFDKKFSVSDLLVKILLVVNSLLGILSIIMLTLVAREIANLQAFIYVILSLIIVSSVTKIYNIYKVL